MIYQNIGIFFFLFITIALSFFVMYSSYTTKKTKLAYVTYILNMLNDIKEMCKDIDALDVVMLWYQENYSDIDIGVLEHDFLHLSFVIKAAHGLDMDSVCHYVFENIRALSYYALNNIEHKSNNLLV